MEKQQLLIPVEKQHPVFKDHLDAENNERIIFSGIFGIGKSYFLKDFFEKHKEEYLAINLAPVNYSISSNEDIFKLIKYDILYELIMTHELELDIESVNKLLAFAVMLPAKAKIIFENLVAVIPFLNKEAADFTPLITLINTSLPLFEEVNKVSKDVNLNSRVEAFIKDINQGHLFEEDFITKFVEQSLNNLSCENKKKVLIIDDLDRIDPEHIFRLFNIFSSHLNYNNTTTNKFGFDKVVFVCDIDNIRNIFSNRYGTDVDFSGYIDKFYSSDIFHFNNNESVVSISNALIWSIDFGDYKDFLREHLARTPYNEDGLLTYLIKQCINSGSLSIRRIKSVYGRPYKFKERKLPIFNSREMPENWRIPGLIGLEILTWIFGGVESTEKALQKLIKFGRSRDNQSNRDQGNEIRLAGNLIPFLDYKNHQFKVSNRNSYDQNPTIKHKFKIDTSESGLEYELIRSGDRLDQYYAYIATIEENAFSKSTLFEIIYKTFLELKDGNYLK